MRGDASQGTVLRGGDRAQELLGERASAPAGGRLGSHWPRVLRPWDLEKGMGVTHGGGRSLRSTERSVCRVETFQLAPNS